MRLEKDNIILETNGQGEIKSIKFLGQEILHDGSQWWTKTYPMIWPNISFSHGFEVNGKNYELPKHGFWKEMQWQSIFEGDSISLLATHFADNRYPFTIDIQQNIAIEGDDVVVKTTFSNLSKEEAYFHFGHHPAFKIDKDSQVFIGNETKPQALDLQGKLTKDHYELKKLSHMGFGVDYDTLVFKDVEFEGVNFKANGLSISVLTEDFASLQIWKPKDAMFVCIEPWQGWNDPEYNAPREASEKLDIVALPSGETKEFTIRIRIKK